MINTQIIEIPCSFVLGQPHLHQSETVTTPLASVQEEKEENEWPSNEEHNEAQENGKLILLEENKKIFVLITRVLIWTTSFVKYFMDSLDTSYRDLTLISLSTHTDACDTKRSNMLKLV